MTFLALPKISSLIPSEPIDRSSIKIPHNIKLADPHFHRPAPIEALLGVGAALSLLCIGQINLSPPNGPDLYLQKTRLGWVIGGSTPASNPIRSVYCHTTSTLQNDIAKFWELEDGPQIQHLSKSEKACETHFKENTTRDAEGRYIVALPFNGKEQQLGESQSRAIKRFISLERKLQQEPETKRQYHEVMREYLDLGHMSKVKTGLSPNGLYLPHHGVKKIASQTTKLRVVFDGSAETTTGISLNDTLHTGPKLQDDLLYILLRFRIHQYVLTGDIEKMYRQIIVRPEDRKYQCILWRDSTGEISTYQLNTVTFGLSAAPFLAIRCLKQLALDEGHRFPHASTILQRDFYVDDALTGSSTIEEGLVLRKNLTRLLNLAGMKIRQWASNDRRLLQGLPENHINNKLHLGESSTIKTLGIYWNSSDDCIGYSVSTTADTTRVTKRSISSEIAKIYDPLGLLGPVVIVAKLLLQQIWTMKIDWDESLPMDLHTEWTRYYTQLPLLNNATFKRSTIIESPTNIELHGFCDASEKAYGACIYLRSIDVRGNIRVELLLAKSKVAPIKTQTIPRLELSGALLLSSLATTVQRALHVKVNRSIFWTDSTIVLHWINTSPHSLKTFVANRVSEIQTRTSITDWRHVRTEDNPADLISRGQSAVEFLQPSIWQQGPAWLKEEESHWPTWDIKRPTTDPEQKTAVCLITTPIDTSLLERYSSWGKLQRIIARCLRWKRCNTQKGPLTVTELRQAHNRIIKLIQGLHFPEELQCLAKEKSNCITGKLQRLNPFVDQDGVLRVGGRLKHSLMPFSKKHPIILPKTFVTRLIIENEHQIHLHAGVQATLYAVREKYWPIDGRGQVWKAIKNCIRCCRAQPLPTDYVMGDLPATRVIETRPFTNTGVDYCGPFFIKEKQHRNRNRVKVYIAVFVCLAVKAVHLELVSDLTSEAFIAALRRFIARRGFCVSIQSDNGTNFVGANNELRELYDLLRSDDHINKVQTFLSNRLIQWHFIPPQAPHFGGLWEAAVKSLKYHLTRVVGAELFTFENFNTLVIEVESILNSRPLTPISSDPNDLLVLTPGHFLIGDSLMSLRERDFRDVPTNRLSHWQQIQKVKQFFWARWHREYLNELTTRSKWSSGSHNITKGAIVLLREDNIPPTQWALGRVTQIHPGSDGIVRAVTVKTATSVLVRSVKKLAPLPIEVKDDTSQRPETKEDDSDGPETKKKQSSP
ncbi:hypothetical protein ANTPLA_LOCUS8006 [Anthophora plagiata]